MTACGSRSSRRARSSCRCSRRSSEMSANEASLTGVGQSQIGVKLTRPPLLLTVDAVREALNEAGLTISQIDGVSTYPGRGQAFLGFSPVGPHELIDALRIRATWQAGGDEITPQLCPLVAAP